MMQRVAEKRRAPRMPVQWPVRARAMEHDRDFEGLRSFDVSKGGLGLEFARPLERDTVLKLEFIPGEGQPEVRAYAFVAWSTVQGRAGLRFIGIAEEDEERLAGLVERHQRALSRLAAVN